MTQEIIDLVEQAKQGSQKAFSKLYYKYNLMPVLCIQSPLIVKTDTYNQREEHGLEHYKKWKNSRSVWAIIF